MTGFGRVSTDPARANGCRLRRVSAIALGAACTLLLATSPALAAPQVDGVFSVTGLAMAALASILHGATSQASLVSLSSDALEGPHLR